MIDAEPGQRAYRYSYSSPTRNYYRELEIVRVTPKQIVAKTKMRQQYRFWRKNGREVGAFCQGYIALEAPPEGDDRYVEAGCDKGRSW